MQRPSHFELDYSHPLARGLVFAGLGNAPGANRWFDSSVRKTHGVFTTAPSWRSCRGRNALYGNSDTTRVTITGDWDCTLYTIACWYLPITTVAYDQIFSLEPPSKYVVIGAGASNYDFHAWGGSATDSGVAFSTGTPVHLAALKQVGVAQVDGYVNGVDTCTGGSSATMTAATSATIFDSATYGGTAARGYIWDTMIWERRLSDAEMMQLADLSNVMLSGLIREVGDYGNVYNLEGVR